MDGFADARSPRQGGGPRDLHDKAAAPQLAAGPAGTVFNVYRHRPGIDAPIAGFTPRSLREHEHATLQVSVLLRDTIAAVGWQGGSGTSGTRRLHGGQAYVVPYLQPHDFHLEQPRGMVNFHIDRDALVALSPAHFEPDARVLDELCVIDDVVMTGLAAGVHAAALVPDRLTPLYVDAAWTLMAMQLARLASTANPSATALDGRLPPRRLARVIAYVDAHFADADLRVGDLAAVAGLSPVHFTRVFTRAVGRSPMQFVIARRLDRACDLLVRADASISAIALDTGFGSHARFSEAFRRRFGTTPSLYRYGASRPPE